MGESSDHLFGLATTMHLLPALWLLEVLASPSTGLAVETPTPDALCPELEATRTAVSSRLGILDTEARMGWRAVYSAGHAPDKASGDFVRLELFDPSGALRLRRDLPRGAEPCAAMAHAIALVLERYFRTLTETESHRERVGTPGAMASAATTDIHPESAKSGSLDGQPLPSPVRDGEERTESRAQQLSGRVSAGVSGAFLLPARVMAAELGLRASPSASWALTARVAFPTGSVSEPVGPGRAYLWTVPIRIGLVWLLGFSRMQFALGPEMLFSMERGWTEGIARTDDRHRAVFGLGLQVDGRYWLTRRLALTLAAGADWLLPLASSRFVVSGQDVLDTGTARGFVSVGLLFAGIGEGWNGSGR